MASARCVGRSVLVLPAGAPAGLGPGGRRRSDFADRPLSADATWKQFDDLRLAQDRFAWSKRSGLAETRGRLARRCRKERLEAGADGHVELLGCVFGIECGEEMLGGGGDDPAGCFGSEPPSDCLGDNVVEGDG